MVEILFDLQLQLHCKMLVCSLRELVSTALQNFGADSMCTYSLAVFQSLQLPLQLTARDRQVGEGDERWSNSKIHD